MKKFYVSFLLILTLSGCAYINANPPTRQEQFCSEVKRNIIFNTASSPSLAATSPMQQAAMMRLYDKNNCDQVLKK